MTDATDNEANRLSARLRRYANVGTNMGGAAAGIGVRMLAGRATGRSDAQALAAALGGLKGPLMKVAQMLSTIPEALPAEFAEELSKLQSAAPPMGWPFVRRRMAAELGPDWQSRFASFTPEAAASASLGQVHRATAQDGAALAVKLQYPDMQSAVEADLNQLKVMFALHRQISSAIDTSQIAEELAARLREELDYTLEARHIALYREMLSGFADIRVPTVRPELSTRRLLTMGWLEGRPLMQFKTRPEAERETIARALFKAWWHPFSHYGAIHGDPHLGNYAIFEEKGVAAGINLLDYGCIRTFAPRFVAGVIELYRGLEAGNRDQIVHAYETWGFAGLSGEVIDILTIWAKFIYGPLLDDRVRRIAEDVTPGQYGRREAYLVHQGLKEKGPVTIPREFVFMDRAAIGLGGVFLHLDVSMNYHTLFNDQIGDFDLATVAERQRVAFGAAGVPLPV